MKQDNTAPDLATHPEFSIGLLAEIYTASSGQSFPPKCPILMPKVLLLEGEYTPLTRILINDIPPYLADLDSVRSIEQAMSSLWENDYSLVCSVLKTHEGLETGLRFAKLIVETTGDLGIKRIQDKYSSVPIIVSNPGDEDDVLAVFKRIMHPRCNIFPYSDENLVEAVRYFLDIQTIPGGSKFN